MIETRQVNEKHGVVLELVPEAATQCYRIKTRSGVDRESWQASQAGTVIRADAEFFLVHNPGHGEVRIRIANRSKAYLYCVEVKDPNSGWHVPLAPSWLISKNYRTAARLVPDNIAKRFAIEVDMGVGDESLEAATHVTFDDDLSFEIDGRRCNTSMERIRGEMRLRNRYENPEDEARDRSRFEACRNRYGEAVANDLRPWTLEDIVPRPDDVFQERLYAIQWLAPDGRIFFTSAREEDLAREREVENLVRANLADWQLQGLVPDARIEPGNKTDEPIRTRGWTHWHHLFTPRHLLMGATIQNQIKRFDDPVIRMALGLVFCPVVDRLSKLTQWRIGFPGSDTTAQAADSAEHVFYNQALNTFYNYGNRSSIGLRRTFFPDFKHYPLSTRAHVQPQPANHVSEPQMIWVTDPPYADAVQYHEILEYFLAWLAKSRPWPDWGWDSRRALAIRGESISFRRSMVEAYSAMAAHMPDNGFQVVMFTHQDVGVWADLAEILWAAGFKVTSGWCVATETESATRVGNYVQGTVLLVLRKRLGDEAGFIARLQRPVENAVQEKLRTMRALDHGEEPNFGDADYQLSAYAAALEVLTRFATIDNRPVAAEVLRERRPGEVSEVERLLHRAVRIASDFLVPKGLKREAWDELGPEERFYLKGLDLERSGETRAGAYQEMARGFGVEDYRAMLGSTAANKVRLKTAKEFGRRDLRRAGSQDQAEDRALEAFAGGLVRHVLYGINAAREAGELRVALDWFQANLPQYWSRQRSVMEILDYIASIRTAARAAEAEITHALRGAVDNHRP
jgi:putative DNA methylase